MEGSERFCYLRLEKGLGRFPPRRLSGSVIEGSESLCYLRQGESIRGVFI